VFVYFYFEIQIFRDIDMNYRPIINTEANLPLPNEYINVLRKHDQDSYDSQQTLQGI
jgi:hypothetical protein